ncbi:MAG: class I SAM-dependent methyltransferase, partial [Polyangiales bacterium]
PMATRVLSHDEARAFYDGFGRKQDLQRIYEDPAVDVLLRHADFETARAVVELGCGTGRLAARLLRERLPTDATYVGFDISQTMVELARSRVEPWAARANVQLTAGSPTLPVSDGACDRFLSTYVLDLLGEDELRGTLSEARRLLAPGGLLCLASLTFGETIRSRLATGVWTAIHTVSPRLVGGCRPLRLGAYTGSDWRILHREVVCAFGICTEVLIAA